MRKRYRLRKAAGSWWLLDLAQSGKQFKQPLELNESAAQIWQMYEKGLDVKKIAASLAGEYEVSQEEILEDVRQFLEVLRRN